MDLKNKSAVILLSGGLDSSTVTGLAKASKAKIFGLSFDYGQRLQVVMSFGRMAKIVFLI